MLYIINVYSKECAKYMYMFQNRRIFRLYTMHIFVDIETRSE